MKTFQHILEEYNIMSACVPITQCQKLSAIVRFVSTNYTSHTYVYILYVTKIKSDFKLSTNSYLEKQSFRESSFCLCLHTYGDADFCKIICSQSPFLPLGYSGKADNL